MLTPIDSATGARFYSLVSEVATAAAPSIRPFPANGAPSIRPTPAPAPTSDDVDYHSVQLPLISSCTSFARMAAPTGDPLPYTTRDASPLGSTSTCCWILSY